MNDHKPTPAQRPGARDAGPLSMDKILVYSAITAASILGWYVLIAIVLWLV